MSLLWTKPASLYLSPSCMALCQPARRRAAEGASLRVTEGFYPAAGGLTKLLSSSATQLKVVLSNHYVRYQLVLPPPGIKTTEELLAWSALRFETDAGLDVGGFEQRLSAPHGKQAVLACAIDKSILKALEAERGTNTLVSVEPLFVTVFNESRKRMRDGLLAVVEPGRIVLGGVTHGVWNFMASRFVDISDRAALQTMLADYLAQIEGQPVLWLFDPAQVVDTPTSAQANVQRIESGQINNAAVALGLAA